ncbi:MAG: hypothetical protein KAW41_01360 [Candidatus Diapherotrites archaeon]|nr:hypothetical protein [Candidatus Diapherotrites archaeon]
MDELDKSIVALEETRKKMTVKQPGLWKPLIVIAVVLLAVAALVALSVIVVERTGITPPFEVPAIGMPEVELPGLEAPTASPTPSAGAFPLTGSYVCTVGGREYQVYEESYFYLDGDNLRVVSDGRETTVTPAGDESTENIATDFFVSAPGASCVEDSGPGGIMEDASETGVLSLGGTDYVIEAWK